MRLITIDADKVVAEMEESKYKLVDSSYAKGCNEVVDFYIKKLNELAEMQNK